MARHGSIGAAFEIWQAGGRILSIDNPVRLHILRQLEHGPRTLNELVATTKKAKSTLSALHMPPLLETGLVQQSLDPHDARVKWYKLAGARLGSSAVAVDQLRDAVLGYVRAQGLVPVKPVVELLDLRALVAATKKAYSDGVAQRLGLLVARTISTKEPGERARQIASSMERDGFGRMVATGPAVRPDAQHAAAMRAFLQHVADAAMAGPAAVPGVAAPGTPATPATAGKH